MRSLSVIIPNYNGEKLLREFLPSVLAALDNYSGPKELVLADDCSTDPGVATAAMLAAGRDWVRIVSAGRNGGFSAACNMGAASAGHEILFFLNNDVRLEPDYFSGFSGYFDDETVFAVAPCGFSWHDRKQIDGVKTVSWSGGFLRFTGNIYNAALKPGGPYLSFSVQGAYFFADRAKFFLLGGFDELYSPYIMEETDLAYRALKRGWKIVYGRDFKGYHRVGSSIQSKTSRTTQVISARNRLVFTWKNIHSAPMLAWHFVCLGVRLLGLSAVQWRGFFAALAMLGPIRRARAAARAQAGTDDRALLDFYLPYFAALRSGML
ncbi:MAG: glycosyltransferase family 2 protein [Elusimicrobiaceae bacterium]|nr:glycosyltransferase family 2 protein [Elusimicrobiaceae bacterium]